MILKDLSVVNFLNETAGEAPVPGGGSISALAGALAAALAQMVAGLTIGKKKYLEHEEEMKAIVAKLEPIRAELLQDIDRDSDAYRLVFDAFKLPKETDEEKALRSEKIQEATRHAAIVPMTVARRVFDIIGLIEAVGARGNQNAITDAAVAMMCARTAVLGALLNVRINLSSIKDEAFRNELAKDAERMESLINQHEEKLLQHTYQSIQ